MIEDALQLSFRGVRCLHCRRPIPVSPAMALWKAGLEGPSEAQPPTELRCQVFHLRCFNCGKEKPYKMTEIVEFHGPTPLAFGVKPKSSRLSEVKNRAANG